jgi:methanogenic corrinoid protein MtbC1
MTELKKLYEAILSGDNKTALAVTQQAVSEGVQPMELITNYMIPAMSEVGRRFECE